MCNVPHRLVCLNTRSLAIGTAWGGDRTIRRHILGREVGHWGWALKAYSRLCFLVSSCFLCVDEMRCILQDTPDMPSLA